MDITEHIEWGLHVGLGLEFSFIIFLGAFGVCVCVRVCVYVFIYVCAPVRLCYAQDNGTMVV